MTAKSIIVFGATGKAGQQVVEQALQNRMRVTAFTRQSAFSIQHEQLHIMQGELDHAADLQAALEGQDCIVSALGARDFTRDDPVVSSWLRYIIPLAEASGIQRIAVIAGAGMLQADEQRLNRDLPSYPEALKHVNHDHDLVFQALQASKLEWTLFCPPTIKDGTADGDYVTAVNYHPQNSQGHISAGNLAHCIVQTLQTGQFIRQRVGIGTPLPTGKERINVTSN
ncbi:MAG: NAD(P)H-binding protein [Chloroflexota bacterium]|nr:NAD(P)H-binding protein [Chloroflexota bacterium]